MNRALGDRHRRRDRHRSRDSHRLFGDCHAVLAAVATLAALLLPAAAATTAPAPTPSPTPSPTPAPAPSAPDAAVDDAVHRVELSRELNFKTPVVTENLAPDAVRPILAEELAAGMSDDKALARTRVLSMLGMLPEDYPLQDKLLTLLDEQVAGFYLPKRKRMVVVDLPPERIAEMSGGAAAAGLDLYPVILSHELAHALVDQHFDLSRLLDDPALEGRDDVQFARQALAEGDATLVMMLVSFRAMGLTPTPQTFPAVEGLRPMIQTMGPGAFPAFNEAPEYLKTQLLEPYLLGLDLVASAWKKGGWPAVDALWRNPPQSTEQLLHADKRTDPPVRLAIDPEIPAGWSRAAEFELGELGLRTWLSQTLDASGAAAAAAGWGGDRVALIERPHRPAPGDPKDAPAGVERGVVLFTAWDSAKDAAEFAAGAERVLFARSAPDDEWRIDTFSRRVRIVLQKAYVPPAPPPPPPPTPVPIGEDPWARPPSSLEPTSGASPSAEREKTP